MATAAVGKQNHHHLTEELSVRSIKIASIKVGKRLRPLGDISSLVESIREVGLINPISVTRDGWLVSGLHRLEAYKALERRTIPAVILAVTPEEAQLREIDENLSRNDLTLLERAEHLHLRKELYEQIHPETRRGGNHGNQHVGGRKRQNGKLPFCQTAASLTRQSTTTVQRLVRIAKLLTTEAKELVRGTEWENNQRALMKLCKLTPEMQEKVARKAANGESRDIGDAIIKVHRDKLKSKRRVVPLEDGDNVQCGDCITLMAKMQAGSVGLIVTSPPYNLLNSSGNGMKDTSGSKWQNNRLADGYDSHHDAMPHGEYVKWQRKCLASMMRVLRDDGAIFYNHKWRVQDGLLQDRFDIVKGFPVRQVIIWQRDGGINFNTGYFLPTYEVIYLICKTDFTLAPGANAIGDVWHIPPDVNNPHPAPFPVALAQRCIESTTADVVLDPFMGSGSTAIAAEKCNRRWVGIDISPDYCDVANERIQAARKASGQRVLKARAMPLRG
jgi:modification methylase